MNKKTGLPGLTDSLSTLDNRVLTWIRANSNLLIALVSVSLALWALFTGHYTYVLIMAVIGAVGYFAGLVVALSCGVLVLIINVVTFGITPAFSSLFIVQGVGYLNIAWLGFCHRRIKKERQRAISDKHPDQVVPWASINEVRTSLAAIRFLLFPMHKENMGNELQKATNELLRLEQIFKELEDKQLKK